MQNKNRPDLLLDKAAIKQARLLFRAVNHELRKQILNLLHLKEEMKVTDIYNAIERIQSETSQHLAIMRKAGIVNARRDGKQIFYSINYKRLRQLEAKAMDLG